MKLRLITTLIITSSLCLAGSQDQQPPWNEINRNVALREEQERSRIFYQQSPSVQDNVFKITHYDDGTYDSRRTFAGFHRVIDLQENYESNNNPEIELRQERFLDKMSQYAKEKSTYVAGTAVTAGVLYMAFREPQRASDSLYNMIMTSRPNAHITIPQSAIDGAMRSLVNKYSYEQLSKIIEISAELSKTIISSVIK